MKATSQNLLHDWKSARLEKSYISQVEFLGSGIRTSFLHVWVATVVKVLLIFMLMSLNIDLGAEVEKNVALLDQYVRNDFAVEAQTTAAQNPMWVVKSRRLAQPRVVSLNIQPRGPHPAEADLPTANVAGDSTTDPGFAPPQ